CLAYTSWRGRPPPWSLGSVPPGTPRLSFVGRRSPVLPCWSLRFARLPPGGPLLHPLSGPLSRRRPPSPYRLHIRFDSLSTEAVLTLAHRYRTTYLVTRGTYPFPLRFSAGRTRVYALPPS